MEIIKWWNIFALNEKLHINIKRQYIMVISYFDCIFYQTNLAYDIWFENKYKIQHCFSMYAISLIFAFSKNFVLGLINFTILRNHQTNPPYSKHTTHVFTKIYYSIKPKNCNKSPHFLPKGYTAKLHKKINFHIGQ